MSGPVVLLSGLLLLVVLTGCAPNPVTGRQDFVMMSEAQELTLGRQASQQLEQQLSMVGDEALQAYVQGVGQRLAQASHRPGLDYRFRVVDSADVNAFALPGGHIYIHRGLLAYLNSEAELAAVLGHELGHVTARHGVRQQSMAMGTGLLSDLLTIGTGVRAAGDLSNILGTAMVRGYGREMELEADGLGAEYLARTGYRPQAMLSVIGVLKDQDDYHRQRAAAEGREVAGYHGLFATHPTHDQRLRQVVARAEALAGDQAQHDGIGEYLKAIDGLVYGSSAREGIVRGSQFFHVDLDLALSYPQGWVLVNRPDVLLAHTPDQQGFIALVLERLSRPLTAEELLRQRAGNQRLVQEQAFSGPGYQGYMAIIPGNQARRVAAIVRGEQAFLFVAGFRGRGPLELYDAGFVEVIGSFRALEASERAQAEPLRIRLRRARVGDNYASLAQGSPLGEEAEARLRLLNGHWPTGEPAAGQWLKVVK
ncbi:M48 family metalloprotease [Halopseudomonas phragmitis]|uniref:Peptidase M48 Ste24p n=2 Tax=Pseudomonadaceae TaxID=135621 RepID=A0A1V0B1R6_9GAMM|nr:MULTISPECIES: M48 family metalloprotease [Pseudomonadaceae]AQZ93883.1 peptidase M48 Ste24p [Halopseudomonas phragmitis]RHW20472.1 peptidase M48 Ste24p [Pseudomonas jilinensis]